MSWKENGIMSWKIGSDVKKVTDHNRSSLSEDIERFENKKRMADSTLRRYSVAKKRTWTCSWENLPSTNNSTNGLKTADGGMAGEEMEDIANQFNGVFRLILRRGSAKGMATPNPADSALPFENDNFYIANVMITEFSKTVLKRGPKTDLWSLSITLEEV